MLVSEAAIQTPRPAVGQPLVAVVILNWNGYDVTVECVRSVERLSYGNYSIFIVDNDSRDGSADRLNREFPGATLLRLRDNLGYSGGNNAGILAALEAGADYILLLNNDAELAPDAVTELVSAALSDPAAGIVGCVVFERRRPHVVEHSGGRVHMTLGYHGRPRSLRWRGPGDKAGPESVDWVTGCAMMLTRKVIESIGLLDEDFFCYCEDMDLCLRARQAGFNVLIAPRAIAWHEGFGTSGRSSTLPVYYYVRNQNVLLNRFRPFRFRFTSRLREHIVLASTVVSVLISDRPKRASVRAALRGLRDFRANKLGRLVE